MYNSGWYNNLIRPPFSPPDWIFAPVWIILYLMMFVSLGMFIYSKGFCKKWGYIFFTVQLFLNLLWSPSFFGVKNIELALYVIVMLDIFVFLTIKEFFYVSKMAAYMLIPYMIWILYATYLNMGYLVLN